MNTESKLFDHVLRMEKAVGEGEWNSLQDFFSDDLKYTVGNRPTKHGIDGLKEYMSWQSSLVQWKGHEIHLITEVDNTLIIEVTSFFYRHKDKTEISVPCTDIYRFREDKIYDWRVYSDISFFDNL